MKKIFTLTVGILMTVVMFAADRRPSVTIKSSNKFEIVIDGRSYSGNTSQIRLQDAFGGRHTVQVFQQGRGFFGKGKKQVDISSFKLLNNDVVITVDRFGQISILEVRGWNKMETNHDYGNQKGHQHF